MCVKVVDALCAGDRPRVEALLLQLVDKAEQWKALNRISKHELHESRDQCALLHEQLKDAQSAAVTATHKFEAEQEARLEQEQETVNHQLQLASHQATIHTLEVELQKEQADLKSQAEQLETARKIQITLEMSFAELRSEVKSLQLSKAAADLKLDQLNQKLKSSKVLAWLGRISVLLTRAVASCTVSQPRLWLVSRTCTPSASCRGGHRLYCFCAPTSGLRRCWYAAVPR
jgi:hypothetical protein